MGGLRNLTKCEEISLLGATEIADGFLHRQYMDSFKKMALRELLRINQNAHYRRELVSIMFNGGMPLYIYIVY